MSSKGIEVPVEYFQIQKIVGDYKEVICSKFRKDEAALVQELELKAQKLKQSIAYYKKQTSNENIEKLITKKRHQKEAERLELEIQWRNLTEKYKKMQEDEKKVIEENRQSKFDLENLQTKILQLRSQNKVLDQNIQRLKNQVNSPSQFITEANINYSPSAKLGCLPEAQKQSKKLQKELISKPIQYKEADKQVLMNRLEKQNNQKNFSNTIMKRSHEVNRQLLQEKVVRSNKSKAGDINIHSFRSSERGVHEGLSKNNRLQYRDLLMFLDRPEIRDEIFDMLRREQQSRKA